MAPDAPRGDAAARTLRGLWLLYGVTIVVVALMRIDNNFLIFRHAYQHLVAGLDLYAEYPALHEDQFKYSPTFALLFAPFSVTPMRVGLFLWTALNIGLPAWGLTRLFKDDTRAAAIALAIAYLDVLRSAQRAQSNGMVAACFIAAFLWLRAERESLGGASIAMGTAVKLFPIAGGALSFLFHRPVRSVLWIGVSVAIALLLPFVFLPTDSVLMQYASWKAIVLRDTSSHMDGVVPTGAGLYGGVMTQFRIWFDYTGPNWPIQAIGTLVLLVPLAVRHTWRDDPAFRLRFLASLMVYAVIFNHQTESPTFVIAMCGIGLWYAASPKTRWHDALMWLSLIVVSVSSTDLVPPRVQDAVFIRYLLKTVPCAFIWVFLQFELLGLTPWTRERTRVLHDATSGGVGGGDQLATAR
jgi:hypothetical protein